MPDPAGQVAHVLIDMTAGAIAAAMMNIDSELAHESATGPLQAIDKAIGGITVSDVVIPAALLQQYLIVELARARYETPETVAEELRRFIEGKPNDS